MKRLGVAVGLCALISVLLVPQAVAISITGAELFSEPSATFLVRTPVVDGSALRFEGGGNGLFEEIFQYPLLAPNSGASDLNFSFALNMTRLGCDDIHFGCAGGTIDHDVNIGVIFGDHALTANYSDGEPDGDGVIGAAFWNFAGNWGLNGLLSEVLAVNSGFPHIGETYDALATFSLAPSSTSLAISFLGKTHTKKYAFGLDLSGGVKLAMFKDNDNGERYQINTFRLNQSPTLPVPEPNTLALMGIGVACLRRFIERPG